MADRMDDASRHAADDALRLSEERFRLLVDSVADYAIFMLDPTGIIQSWNVGAQRLKGYAAAEVIGRHYSLFYTPELREERWPERLLATALAEGRAEHSGWRVRKDGSRFWADVVITALFDDAGVHTGFAKVTRDMTQAHETAQARERALEERQHAISRLQELDEWRRELVGAIVHDLQTPIIGISGFVDLLATGAITDEERPQIFERLRSNARSLQELVTNLRSYTLLSDGRVQLQPEKVALRDFAGDLVADMSPVLADHPVRLTLDELDVEADRGALERVLRNLLGNAARHTPDGTPVQVRGYEQGDDVVLEVRDEGPGVPPQLLARMFDRFERGTAGGTGLGLSIARQLVELHGGTIDVESAPGEGATFRVRLPRRRP
ncbi:ATP-binding protein [Egicoccus sp. AB-alg2]|uniref:PAS domain-containing sensor histidine kinase n=1 Tax=Egicoccus sp. AB-alg2 TaxID=3242693 RepID=UPI00359DF24B